MKTHVLVIGSGLAGTLICNEFVKDARVTLLEAGAENIYSYPEIAFLQKEFGSVKTCCIGGGGTTNLWHNGLIPIHPEDIRSDVFRAVLETAEPFTDPAASRLFFAGKSFRSEYGATVAETTAAVEVIGGFPDGLDCLIYPKVYERLSVHKLVDAFYGVREIEVKIGGSRLQSVGFSAEGKHFSFQPDVLIVCAGALGTPALVKMILEAAGRLGKEAGIGFADHPMGFVGKVKVKKSVAPIFRRLSLSDRGGYASRAAIRLKSACGNHTCCAFFRPALTMENRLSIYKYKSQLGASKGGERLKSVFSPKLFHPDILAEIYAHLCGANIPTRTYNILMIFEQKRGSSRVTYQGERILIDWRITEAELAVYNAVMGRLKDMLEPIADELVIQTPITHEWLWSAAHHSGTLSLGPPPDSLIDSDLRLHGVDNVFVCDGSVIQEHSYANTGLTIGQLALRLAEHVRITAL
jgi:choline dehydrogenase-like flavoprotein